MEKTFMRNRSFLAVTLHLLLLMLLAGCLTPGGSGFDEPPKIASAPPEPTRTLEEVEKDIEWTQDHIENLEEYETQQRQIGVINEVEHDRTRGWVKLDGEPTYEEVADLAYAQAAATEKEIQRLERQLDKLRSEKERILSESRGCFPPGMQVEMEDGTFKELRDIAPGDKIQTYDIGYETVAVRPVVERYMVDGDHLYTINGELQTTGGERLLTSSGWKAVRDLKTGDAIHVDGRMVAIDSISYQRVGATLSNLQVEDTHNFYVITANGVRYLVHNTSGGGGGGGGGGTK